MKLLKDISFNQTMRLRTIEVLINNYGFVSRQTLGDFHDVGSATVSRDLALYKKLNPGVHYNKNLKTTERLVNFKPIFN